MKQKVDLKVQQALFWNDHYWLTRQVIRDAAIKSPCMLEDTEYLYENQSNIGKNFGKLTHNKKAGRALTKELRVHIDIALEIVVAALGNHSIDALYKKWKKNAKKIAEVYHKYHKKIRYSTTNKMMQEHLKTTLAEAVAIISDDCEASAEKGEIALNHIREMSAYINSKFQ